jgi:hypothetical protein
VRKWYRLFGELPEQLLVGRHRQDHDGGATRPLDRPPGPGGELALRSGMPEPVLLGIEVKATASPTAQDARHLVTLRDRLGETLVAGVVLHTGPRVYRLADRIVAAPISSLWSV